MVDEERIDYLDNGLEGNSREQVTAACRGYFNRLLAGAGYKSMNEMSEDYTAYDPLERLASRNKR